MLHIRQFYKTSLENLNHNLTRASLILLGIAALLVIVSLSLINSTVKLNVYNHRFIIHTMKLVGATGSFIRRPFLAQGVATGIVSAILAIGMLSAIIFWAQSEITSFLSTEMLHTILISFGVMILSGVVITLIATYLSVTRYLRLNVDDMFYI